MDILKKIIPLLLSLAIISTISLSASAAEVDISQTNAIKEAPLLAADFEVSGTKLESDSVLPSSYSSKEAGYTTDIREQIYNTCWAYGSCSTLETALLKKGYPITHFAPMHMNHWGTLRENGSGWNRNETAGGYSYISLGYFTSWQGPRLEIDYPEITPLSDFAALDLTSPKQFAVNRIIYLDTGDVETVKTAVYEYGAVVGNYHVDESNFNPLTDAYYCNTKGLTTAQLYGHCISIVGWDDNFSKENFIEDAQPENDGAWLCKNSWGEYWGDEGYYWISYEDTYLFDTRFGHSYAFTEVDTYKDSKTLYQNEVDGATYEFNYISNFDSITYINVFDKNSQYDVIEKVNFESTSEGATYTIYSIPVSGGDIPQKNRSYWEEIGSGTIEYKGYHSIDTEDFIAENEKFAIGIEIKKTNGSENGIGISEWLSTGDKYIFTPQSTSGMSYISCGNSIFMDVMDFYSDYLQDDIGGTFVIKAIGRNHDNELLMGDVDFSGKLSVIDATHIQRYLALLEEFTDEQKQVADLDEDTVISVMDATYIQISLIQSGSQFEDF